METLDLDRRCREIGREFACFVHQGSCDGKNMAFYDEWVTPEDLDQIPDRLAAGTLKHFQFCSRISMARRISRYAPFRPVYQSVVSSPPKRVSCTASTPSPASQGA